MSIANYSELQTAVGNWLHDDMFTTIIPDFITIGEASLNRQLRLFQMENTATLSTSITDRFATLPAGFLELIDLAIYADDTPQTLTQVSLASINDRSLTVTGRPNFYAVSSNIVFDIISDEVYTCSLRYYKKLDIATDTTNFLLTAYPDLYLYSALLAAAPYIQDDARIGTWASMLDNAIQATNRVDARTRGKTMLGVEAGLRNSNRGDIFAGE